MIVVDASVVIDALVDPVRADLRVRLAGEPQLAAPAHLDLEVCAVLRRAVGRGVADEGLAGRALAGLRALPVERHSPERYVERIWALRANVTPYDAAYVALAEALDCPLLTADARLARATGPMCAIELVG